MSEGLPDAIVATTFWILAEAPMEFDHYGFRVGVAGVGNQVSKLVDVVVKGSPLLVVGCRLQLMATALE